MKIGINARFLHSEILEGIGKYTWETTKCMVLNNPNDVFYFFFDRQFPDKYLIAPNIKPVIVSPQARHPILFWYWFERALPKAIASLDIDVFYSADNFMSLCLKVPTLLVVHDLAYIHYPEHIPFLARMYYRYFMPKFIDKADSIITVSEFVKSDILKQFPKSRGKVNVGYNAGFNIDKSNRQTVNEPYFIYVGSLNPRKNIKKLLEAFELFHKEHLNYRLVLVGKIFNLEDDILQRLEYLKGLNIIEHKTNVSDGDLKSLLVSAEGLVYVSLFEGFGIPILEAMSHGLPVITSNVTSMPEVAGGAALLVNPHSSSEICDAMTQLVDDSSLRAKLVEKGYERVKDFNWEDTGKIIYSKLTELHKNEKPD